MIHPVRLLIQVLLSSTIFFSPLILTACGGGDNSGSISSQTKRLLGKVYSKLIGDKIGEFNGEVKALTDNISEISGILDIDGTNFIVNGLVDIDNKFSLTFSNTSPSDNSGRIILSDGRLTGQLVAPVATMPDTLLMVSTSTWMINLPTTGSAPGMTTAYKGTIDPSATSTGSSVQTGSCEWNARTFYNSKQVVSYLGQNYTANHSVVAIGNAASQLTNPKINTFDWIKGGNCEPVSFIKIINSVCTKGITADVVKMTGTAYGGGIGDAITSYTNVTDHSFSNENNFGLSSNYSMTCSGGGFDGTFTSSTSPTYSVCLKTKTNNAATTWTSTQTIPHSSTLIKFTTGYASKGNPLRATIFNVGSIVMGFDAVRSEGIAVTGNCN